MTRRGDGGRGTNEKKMKSKGREDRTRGEIEVREARRPEGDGEMSQNARSKNIKSRKKVEGRLREGKTYLSQRHEGSSQEERNKAEDGARMKA